MLVFPVEWEVFLLFSLRKFFFALSVETIVNCCIYIYNFFTHKRKMVDEHFPSFGTRKLHPKQDQLCPDTVKGERQRLFSFFES